MEQADNPIVTVVVVPRERFGLTQRSLEDLYEHTTLPFHLIYVEAGAPTSVRRYLEAAAAQRRFQLIQADRFLSPNEARNLAWRHVRTKYVVFLDNDVLFTPRWLEELVRCAEETGAWVVGPLYLIGELSEQTVHMAGGLAHISEEGGQRIFYDEHRLANSPLASVRDSLHRMPCDYVEFHCALVRNEVFGRLGPLDEQLLSVHEHIDLGLLVRGAGGSVYVEPRAVITYVPPPPCDAGDIPYFMMRWSDVWNRASIRRFREKWGFGSVRFFDDHAGSDEEDTILRWARGHRRLVTGMRISGDGHDCPRSPREEAQCMVALFLSMDRERFDLILAAEEGPAIEQAHALDAYATLDQLSAMLVRADEEDLDLMIRPLPYPGTHPVVLLRLDDLDLEQLASVRPYAFLVLATGVETYQCWLAVAKGDSRSAALWRRFDVSVRIGEAAPVRIAGSKMAGPEFRHADRARPTVRLVDGCAGLLHPLWKLAEQGLLPLLRYGVPA